MNSSIYLFILFPMTLCNRFLIRLDLPKLIKNIKTKPKYGIGIVIVLYGKIDTNRYKYFILSNIFIERLIDFIYLYNFYNIPLFIKKIFYIILIILHYS